MNKTKEIFDTTCPYNNSYQGTDKRLLFVCSAGLLRSATGANYYGKKGYNTRSCGSEDYALIPISSNLIHWADDIIFVNKENLASVKRTFNKHPDLLKLIEDKKIVLDIPDCYNYNHKKLIQSFKEQLIIQ